MGSPQLQGKSPAIKILWRESSAVSKAIFSYSKEVQSFSSGCLRRPDDRYRITPLENWHTAELGHHTTSESNSLSARLMLHIRLSLPCSRPTAAIDSTSPTPQARMVSTYITSSACLPVPR